MEEKYNLQQLLEKYIRNSCTREELDRLLHLIDQEEYPEGLTEELRRHWTKIGDQPTRQIVDWDANFSAMMQEINPGAVMVPMEKYRIVFHWKKWAVACIALVFATAAGFFLLSRHHPNTPGNMAAATRQPPTNISSGTNKAILTLADGSTIALDSAHNGMLGTQGYTKIIKMEDGRLLYSGDHNKATDAGYNTIATPRGGKYEIVLPDGTKVWLNAESSLQFPLAFTGGVRKVILNGEGYFEVAKNAAQPFQVVTGNITVQVLGTHFNVNAYLDEESLATTLLEGSVKVVHDDQGNTGPQTVILRPGEQSNLTRAGVLTVNDHANLEEVTAWKNDRFEFNDADISAIMRGIARWYDVRIQYKGAISSRRFTGKFSRNIDLHQLIEMLKYTGIDMKIEGSTIVVSGS